MLQYKDLKESKRGDKEACGAILNSLEKRWSNTDQDVFIAAVILNPFFKHKPFKPLNRFQPASIYDSFLRLWGRFFPEEDLPRVTLYENVLDYLTEKGAFSTLGAAVTACLDISARKVTYLTTVDLRN